MPRPGYPVRGFSLPYFMLSRLIALDVPVNALDAKTVAGIKPALHVADLDQSRLYADYRHKKLFKML